MSSEAKFYPRTKAERESVLDAAWQRNNNLAANSILTQRTKDRLNAIHPLCTVVGDPPDHSRAGNTSNC